MLTPSHHLVMSLLTGAWLARTTFAALDCAGGEVVDWNECTRAIATIVYEKPKNTLDRVSSRFAKLSGNCTIIVNNPSREVVTKQQIEAGFKSIFDTCKPNTGSISLSDSAYVESQNHQSQHDTEYLAPTTLTCGLNSNAPLTVDKDCQDAFDSISVDRWGRLLGDKGKPTPSILKTLKTCTVLIYTTDASQLIAKKAEIGVVVSKTIKECKGQSGVIGSTKGGSGNNGLTVIKVRSSKRCGSRVDSEGQYCAP